MQADAQRDGRPADLDENSLREQESPKMHTQCTSPGDGQTSCKVWLASGERRRCSNNAKTRHPLRFTGVHVPETN